MDKTTPVPTPDHLAVSRLPNTLKQDRNLDTPNWHNVAEYCLEFTARESIFTARAHIFTVFTSLF